MALFDIFRRSRGFAAVERERHPFAPPPHDYEALPSKWGQLPELFSAEHVFVSYSESLESPVRLNGNILTDLDYFRFGLGCRNSHVYVVRGQITVNKRLIRTILIQNDCPIYYEATTRIHLARQGQDFIVIGEQFALKPEFRGQDYARFALALQVRTAVLAGVQKVLGMARGGDDDRFFGHLAWPRLGFDGMIPQPIWDRLPTRLRLACGVLQDEPMLLSRLLSLGEQAQSMWAEHGVGFNLTLSTDPRTPAVAEMLNLLRRARL